MQKPQNTKKARIFGVFISYFPNEKIIENVLAAAQQLDEVVIVDNGSGADTKSLLDKLLAYPRITIIYNRENLGIAAALNIGIKHAKSLGYDWIITFDQDSKLASNAIANMLLAYETYPSKDRVAGLSPRYFDATSAKIWSSLNHDSLKLQPYAETLVAISSGNMVKSSVFDKAGFFNEALFIDHVDNEFCLRCADLGFKILEVHDAVLEHNLGSPTRHDFFGKTISSSNHSALRRYYSARNGVYIYRKFFFKQTGWVIKHCYYYLKTVIAMLLFEDCRYRKLKAVLIGVLHGLTGRMGKTELQF